MTQPTGFQLSGSGPERYEKFVSRIMAPFVAAVLAAAELTEGESVLDLACGTGFAAREAKGSVGSTGRVVGFDVNPGMIEMARKMSDAMSIEWFVGSAGEVPVNDASVDVIVCQQGMQFFPDLPRALQDAVRVLRPAGRFVATAWAPFDRSPYLHAQGEAIQTILGEQAFASFQAAAALSAESLLAAMEVAGFVDVQTSEIAGLVVLDSFIAFAAGHLSALPWGAQLAERGDDAIPQAVSIIADRLKEQIAADGSLTTTLVSTLVSARLR